MQKKIREKIERARIESEFQIELVPRRPRRKGWIRRTFRDEVGNPTNANGDLILTQLHTDSGKTLTPSEQYRLSTLRKKILGIENE